LSEHADVTTGSGYPAIILFRSDKDKDEDFMAEFQEAAMENKGVLNILFAYTNLDNDYAQSLATHFNFERAELPLLRIYGHGNKWKPYHFTTRNATSELITSFIKDVMSGAT